MTETLRSVTAPPTFVPRLPGETRVAPRLLAPGLAVLATGTVALGFVFLRPGPALANGWSAAQTATRQAPLRHTLTYQGDQLSSEVYEALGKVALVTYVNGKLYGEMRSNGKRYYQLSDFIQTRGSVNVAANARVSGVVRNVRYPNFRMPGTASMEEQTEELLNIGKAMRAKNPPSEEMWYDVMIPSPEIVRITKGKSLGLTYLVRVGPNGRIAETRPMGIEGNKFARTISIRTIYDYPDSIPDSVFEPKPHVRPAPVIDADAIRIEIVRRIKRGSGEKLGVNLRLALLDREGKLFVFWTGPGVGEGTRGDIRLPGVRADKPTGIWAELAQYNSPAKRGIAPAIGRPMAARAIVPKVKIGPTLTIAIPGRGGEAIFRNVPILRVDDLRYERKILGYATRADE